MTSPQRPLPKLSSLKRLYIHNCQLSDQTFDSLTPLVFPSLSALACEGNISLISALGTASIQAALRSARMSSSIIPFLPSPQYPHLRALSTSSPPPAWLAKESLLVLECSASNLTAETISHLSLSLRIARLKSKGEEQQDETLDSFLKALRANVELVKEWELRVSVDRLYMEIWEAFVAGCEAIGMRVVVEEGGKNGERAPFDVGFWKAVNEVKERMGKEEQPEWE